MLKAIYFSLVFTLLTISSSAEILCTHCKNKISGKYLLNSQKQPFCSKTCFNSSLPKCSVCKYAITGRYRTVKDRLYCSDRCFSTVLPKCSLCTSPVVKSFKIGEDRFCENCMKRGRCFVCERPAKELLKITDGRIYCKECSSNIVFDTEKAEKIYKDAVTFHEKLMGKAGLEIPPLKFVDITQLKKQYGEQENDGMSLRGYYQEIKKETEVSDHNNRIVSRTVQKTGECIYLLNGMEEKDIQVTAIHELTHDWLSDFYPGIKVAPLWIEEGFCQYVAYTFCMRQKYTEIAGKIKNAPDQVYGKGAKFYLTKFGENNILGAYKWFSSQKYQHKPPVGAKRKD